VAAAAVRVAGSPRWVVTDPVTLAHYDLSEQEYTLLTALRDGASLRDLQRAFERRFAPRRISLDEVWEFVSRLHRAGLAVATGAGQGAQLLERSGKQRREQVTWAWTRLLAIKLPGVNPDGFLELVYPLVRWVFSWPALLMALGVMLFALSLVLADFGAFVAGMPGLAELATPRNIVALLATAIVLKVLHELGHAMACKHFGGQVPEMGVLLLAFTPALYCDVSDMWRLSSKAKRMAVSAAGIFVELCLAALAALVWRYSEPGLVQTAALNVMIVATVGTLLVNANPLLRYDGYYLLSDLTETPNLWGRSREAVSTLWSDWFSRRDRPRQPIQPWWLPLYGLASQLYLVVVLVSIVWMLSVALRPYRLEVLAYAAGAVALAGALAQPLRRVARWSRNPLARRRLRGGRALGAALLAMLVLFGAWHIPWRYSVEGKAMVLLEDSEHVVATVAGRLVEGASVGDQVKRGDLIARLENPEVAREMAELEGRLAEERLCVKQLQAMRARDQDASDKLPAAQALVDDLARQLAALRSEADRLVLRAGRGGVVIRPQAAPPRQESETTLARWSGAPLDEENRGAWIEPGQVLCDVGDPSELFAQVVLTEEDIERVRVGQSVTLAWSETPGVVTRGEVIELAERALRGSDSRQSPDAAPRYFARVRLAEQDPRLLVGGAGRARIDTGSTTIGSLLVTRVRQLFRLP
jgi:putative peptide zinc metalloprotease protein